MRNPTELTTAFRARGLKVTPQRQCIFRILHDNPQHPSAEFVYATAVAEMPTISLRTVYQTLNDLAAMGEIGSLDLGTGSTRFDPNTTPHHHLVCERCGKVRDVDLDASGLKVPRGSRAQGFSISSTEIVLRGLCSDCSRTSSSSSSSSSNTNDTKGSDRG